MPGVQPDGGSRQLPDTPPQQFKQQIRIGDRIAAEQCRDVTEPVPDQAVLRGMDHLRKQLPLPAGIVEYDVLRMQVAGIFQLGVTGLRRNQADIPRATRMQLPFDAVHAAAAHHINQLRAAVPVLRHRVRLPVVAGITETDASAHTV